MGNSGKNSNSSQFFFTLDKAPQCDGKHVIFGEVVSGGQVLRTAESFGSKSDGTTSTVDGTPTAPIRITDCGIFAPLQTPGAGYWYDQPDAESWNGISPTFVVRPRVAIAASSEAAQKKFEQALGGLCSIVLSIAIDSDDDTVVSVVDDVDGIIAKGGKRASELLLESLASFSVDIVVIAPACKDLVSKMREQHLPGVWTDTTSNNNNFAFEEVVLVSKPLDVISMIHTKSWLSKHREHWKLDGQ